jgi:cell wall-associated NlpC family hydrolase
VIPVATATALIAQATRWLGYEEKGTNITVFGQRTGYQGQPWCGSFIDCIAKDAGVSLPGSCVSVIKGAEAFKHAKRYYSTPQVGDIVFFKFGTQIDHVGVVTGTRLWRAGFVTTIEGNTHSFPQEYCWLW